MRAPTRSTIAVDALTVVLHLHREVVLVVLQPADHRVGAARDEADAPPVPAVREIREWRVGVQRAEGTAVTIVGDVTLFGNNARFAGKCRTRETRRQ